MPSSDQTALSIAARVGRTIAAARQRQGKTQADVAEALNVEQQTVSRWESGSRTPSLETLEQLAIQLDCTVGDFLSDLSDRSGYQQPILEKHMQDLTEIERSLAIRHLKHFVALLREHRSK